MESCFTDPDVGTADLNKDVRFKEEAAQLYRKLATENCDHIAFLVCKPVPPATYAACSAYMTAAMNTAHTMIFTRKLYMGLPNWDVLKISDAKLKIKSNADDFIEEYGSHWYFCQCKSERIKQCEQMGCLISSDEDSC